MSPLRPILLLLALLAAAPAAAQDFPALNGRRVVDAANIIPDADEAALTQKLAAVEAASSRQLVVATVPSLGGYPIEDYGYQLGRKWGIGQKGTNNGILLLVAPNDHKVRIEVGYGLEPIMTDALSGSIISERILPRFKAGDFPGGIDAGADAIIAQLQAPPEQAEQAALQAKEKQARQGGDGDGGSALPLVFWGMVLAFVVLRALIPGRRGRRYRRHGVWVWGPGLGGGWGGGSSGGGFGGFGGGGGGGFSGGGGSFGGGGASGGW